MLKSSIFLEADLNIPVSKLLACGLLFLLALVSGVWLTHSGKPYNGVIFNIHKLIALGTVIFTSIYIANLYKAADPKIITILFIMIAAGLLFLALFVSGALLSIGKPASTVTLRIHQVAPLLALGASAVSIYLLVNSQP
jgi:hypothetical protein